MITTTYIENQREVYQHVSFQQHAWENTDKGTWYIMQNTLDHFIVNLLLPAYHTSDKMLTKINGTSKTYNLTNQD